MDQDPFIKSVNTFHDDMDVVAVANFDVTSGTAELEFSKLGTWYELFTSEEFEVDNALMTVELNPGGYKIYTSEPSEFAGEFTTANQ